MLTRLYAGSQDLDPRQLEPGRDVLLSVNLADGLDVPKGCLLDDRWTAEDRIALSEDATQLFTEWRHAAGTSVIVDGLDLAHVWEIELRAQVFLPAAAVARSRIAGPVEASGFAPDALGLLRALLGDVRGTPGGPGRPAPIQRRPPKGAAAAVAEALRRLGVPPRWRADVVAIPYWHLSPVLNELQRVRRGVVAPNGVVLPGVPPRHVLAAALFGGWTGFAGARAREASRADVGAALERGPAEHPLHARAAALLKRSAPASLAEYRHLRRAFARRAPALALLPWDSPDIARVLLAAAVPSGAESLVVQHGFDSQLGDPDKTRARHVAVWSRRDAGLLAGAGTPHITGNPGAACYATRTSAGGGHGEGPPVVMVEYPGRLSALIPARIALRHVEAALQGLKQAGWRAAIVRPHPSDVEVEAYLRLGRRLELDVGVDAATPIDALLGATRLCVGSLSTATLQAWALGVPTVFLDVSGAPRPWPFDGTLPCATSAGELAERAARTVAGEGRELALEALGARPDAVARLVELVRTLAARG